MFIWDKLAKSKSCLEIGYESERRMAPKMDAVGPCTSSESDSHDRHEKVPSSLYDPARRCLYTLGDYLGKGGFARCFAAVDSSTADSVALKVISKSRLTKQSHLEKMRKEIAIHEGLSHQNIVNLLSFFEDSTNVYMVLEFCANNTLLHQIQSSPKSHMTENSARPYLTQIVDAVTYLHEEVGILHRDLKPGNVLLNSLNQVKLADFGLAIRIADIPSSSLSVCGTPNYISPEVLNRQGHSKESEAWSVGCILYCMLVGKPPFETDTLEKTYERIASCDYAIPPHISISGSARDLIARLLDPDAQARLKIVHIKHHRFFVLDEARRMHFNAFTAETSNRQRARPFQEHNDYQHYGTPKVHAPQMGTHSGDSGIGSDGCIVVNRPEISDSHDPLALYNQVMKGYYVVSDDAACSAEGRLLMISKWVDYTNKYGFGCVLSDGTHCVLFTDRSSISYRQGSAVDSDRFLFHFDVLRDIKDRIEWCGRDGVAQPKIRGKLKLASLFSDYMDKELQSTVVCGPMRSHLDALVFQKRKNDALLMVLSHGTAQINFTQSHYKLVLNKDEYGQVTVTVIHPERGLRSYGMVAKGEMPNRPESRWVQDLLNDARSRLEGYSHRPYYATEC